MFINASNASRAIVGLLVLGLAAACGSSSSTAPSTTTSTMSPTSSATVTIPGSSAYGGFAFAPNSITINAGGTVTWQNNDNVTHTSTSDSPGWDLTITAGGSASQTFMTVGTFPYHCRFHNMTGTVIVQ